MSKKAYILSHELYKILSDKKIPNNIDNPKEFVKTDFYSNILKGTKVDMKGLEKLLEQKLKELKELASKNKKDDVL